MSRCIASLFFVLTGAYWQWCAERQVYASSTTPALWLRFRILQKRLVMFIHQELSLECAFWEVLASVRTRHNHGGTGTRESPAFHGKPGAVPVRVRSMDLYPKMACDVWSMHMHASIPFPRLSIFTTHIVPRGAPSSQLALRG